MLNLGGKCLIPVLLTVKKMLLISNACLETVALNLIVKFLIGQNEKQKLCRDLRTKALNYSNRRFEAEIIKLSVSHTHSIFF